MQNIYAVLKNGPLDVKTLVTATCYVQFISFPIYSWYLICHLISFQVNSYEEGHATAMLD